MCTVSFLPIAGGFALAMNRDEKKSRVMGEPPRRRMTGHYTALHPAEPGGGTWIGVNHKGMALALINWHAQPENPDASLSRGMVVPHLLAARHMPRMATLFQTLPLARLNPFRLIAVSLSERTVKEWRWDGDRLAMSQKPWRRAHWFSSGYEETEAARLRGRAALAASRESSGGTVRWLRRLHQSHRPARGPFSICMHREDAQTVSYTEILASNEGARMRYAAGALCKEKASPPLFLAFRGAFA